MQKSFAISVELTTFAPKYIGTDMKKVLITLLILVILALLGGVAYLFMNLQEQKQVNKDMQELAELDKQEMENEYERFALQYSEMKTQINNDSIVEQLTQEQMKTQQLLEELKKVKANDAREITRLKKELATVRAVLRSYIIQVDSLNRLNESLKQENSRVNAELDRRNTQIAGLSSEKASLSEKVAIAAQLDATNIQMTLLDKKDKVMKKPKLKDTKKIQVSFTITKNVTASNGNRTIYVRIQNPGGNTLSGGGTFSYENRNLECSMKKTIEYTGEEVNLSTYWNVTQMLEGGQYRVSIFADGNMIGSRTFNFE
jgi:myosin heavy subunit